MSTDWPTYKFENLLELVIDYRGKTPKKLGGNFSDSGYPVLSAKHVKTDVLVNVDDIRFIDGSMYQKWMKEEVQSGDIILTSEAPMGEVYVLHGNTKYVLGQRVFGLRPKIGIINSEYLAAWLTSATGQAALKSRASGSTVIGIKQSELLKIDVEVPPMPVQCVISDMRSSLNQKIAINRQINQTLESIAQAIFKSWFVNFDPVKAKIAALESGEDPEGVTRAAMRAISGKTDDELDKMEGGQPEDYAKLKTTAELFPAAMQDSELGEVPEGWDVKKITDFGSVVCGKTPPKKDDDNYGGDIPFIKIPDMHGNVFATNTTEYLSVIGEKTQIKKQIPKGSVCVSCIATVGLVSIAAKACHTNQQINSIVPRDIMLTPYLYFSMLERNKLLHDLASGGSTTLNLNTGNFVKIELLNPSFELLNEFYKKVSPIFEMLLLSDYQVQQLTQLRDTLLPKLLSGELSVDTIKIKNEQAGE